MKKDIHSERAESQQGEAAVLRDAASRARADADDARVERERLISQLRDANERLVIATLRSDDLAVQADARRAVATESAAIAAERARGAETLAAMLRESHDQLRASESEALASNRAKDDFLAMLGHELRNPLAPILIALDLIAMDAGDPHKREHAIIEHQVKQLTQLVDDMLDVARIRSGKLELHRAPIEVAAVVARAVETASPLLHSKRHTLQIDVPAHGLVVDGDLLRLTQAVGNLLTNAAKYTPAGGSITVTGARHGSRASLRIQDTGIGISPDMLPRVFDLFAQEHQASDRAAGGLGLGLAIVRSVIALHGGTVRAHSDGIGRGTALLIDLPVLRGMTSDLPIATPGSSAPAPAGAHKILVVDDNRDAAEFTGLALARLGHEVRVAFDGPAALSMIEGFVPDVVLIDIGLPGMDGYQLAAQLRVRLSACELHFIAITGYGQPGDRLRSKEAGFAEHLVKPVDLATLQHSIEAIERPRTAA